MNLTAYCIGAQSEHYVKIINKTHGAGAADACVTIASPSSRMRDAQVMRLLGGQPGDAATATATLGGAAITGDTAWAGQWSPVSTGSRRGIRLVVPAASAAIVRIHTAR